MSRNRYAPGILALILLAGCGSSGLDYDGARREIDQAGLKIDRPIEEWLDLQATDKRGMCTGSDDTLGLAVGMAIDAHDTRAADLMRIAIKYACPQRLDAFTRAYEKAVLLSK